MTKNSFSTARDIPLLWIALAVLAVLSLLGIALYHNPTLAALAGEKAIANQFEARQARPNRCDTFGERDCGLYHDPTGKCDSTATADCGLYRL